MQTTTEQDEPETTFSAEHGKEADERQPLPRLWKAFVLAWSVALVITVWYLFRKPVPPARLVPSLVAIMLLTGTYLGLLLRTLTHADLTAIGPSQQAVRRRSSALVAMTLSMLALVVLLPETKAHWLIAHAVVAAGLALPPRVAAAWMTALVALALGAAWLTLQHFDAILLIMFAFGVDAIAVRQLTIAVAKLGAARQELARLAVADERLRFARDLHDLLGHSLSVIILKGELAARLLPGAPDEATRELGDIERTARAALREVRETVAGYRRPLLSSELTAAGDLLAAAGIALRVRTETDQLPPSIDRLFAWTVREGVMNVVRHSHAAQCTLHVTRAGAKARIEIHDDGRGGEPGTAQDGSGLAGLAERARAERASFHAGPRVEGGFELVVEAPCTSEAKGEGEP